MHNITKKIWSALAVFLVSATVVAAQTCSCAGAPLISSQSISTTSQGNLLLGITYGHKEISELYQADNKLKNTTVERSTQSTLIELNYGITNRLTISGTATYVRKRRLGLQSNDELITTGIGDGVVLLKYVLHQNTIKEQYQLAVGAGAKIPFGKTSLTNDGIGLNLDMQPGTGAWDGVAWSYFSKTFAPVTTINLFLFSTYRATGSAERFGENDNYEFGNELLINIGATNNITSDLSYIGTISYRSTSSDLRNENKLPNTGGKWINLEPALKYQLTDGLSIKASGEIPIYQYLNGLQPTTSYTASISLFYNFGKKVIF
ncbi:hypothetical protein [Fodinibius sp.]|uniref:hypothetical protein n=1 Tax=Fodinibius sp. TaxID=1872440 RepID=UPI002ACDB0BB|nr:hypothetical protein [Fodinibius sp.]MDZ7659005.1 hypothetical protein [Fodinibius sp.]